MDEKKFNRVEKKYLIDEKQYRAMIKKVKRIMEKDSHFHSEIYNVYFDTDNYDLIVQSIDHPIFKEKLRARSYGGYDKVFLEIKTKIRGAAYRNKTLEEDDIITDNNLGSKRRVLITHKDFNELVKGKATMEELASRDIETKADIQIAREVDYIIKHFNLKPKILVYYNRESYMGDDGLRITFDTNLKYRDKNLKFSKKANDKTFFKNDKNIIMEIKVNGAMPLWLVKTLSVAHIYPQQFSKIGKIYETLRKEKHV